jgi:hypothetical protein
MDFSHTGRQKVIWKSFHLLNSSATEKMKDICFMLHESVADDQQQRGICWQIREDAYVPIKHPQIKEPVPRNKQDGLLESLNRLSVGAPCRIEKERNSTFRIIPGEMNRGECFFAWFGLSLEKTLFRPDKPFDIFMTKILSGIFIYKKKY